MSVQKGNSNAISSTFYYDSSNYITRLAMTVSDIPFGIIQALYGIYAEEDTRTQREK